MRKFRQNIFLIITLFTQLGNNCVPFGMYFLKKLTFKKCCLPLVLTFSKFWIVEILSIMLDTLCWSRCSQSSPYRYRSTFKELINVWLYCVVYTRTFRSLICKIIYKNLFDLESLFCSNQTRISNNISSIML